MSWHTSIQNRCDNKQTSEISQGFSKQANHLLYNICFYFIMIMSVRIEITINYQKLLQIDLFC